MGLPEIVAKEVGKDPALPKRISEALSRPLGDAVLYELWVSRAVAAALAAASAIAKWPLASTLIGVGEELLRKETSGLETVAVATGLNPSSDRPSTNHYRLVKHLMLSVMSSGPAPVLAVAYGRMRVREAVGGICVRCGFWASDDFVALAARVSHALEAAEFLDLDEVIEAVKDYLLIEKTFYSSII